MSDLARNIKMESVFGSIPCCTCPYSVLPCYLLRLSKYVLCCSLKTAQHYCLYSLLINQYSSSTHDNSHNIIEGDGEGEGGGGEGEAKEEEEEEEEEEQQQQQQHIALHKCEKHDTEDELTCDDINTAITSLGIEGWRNVQKQDTMLIQEAHKFLDSKNASLKELKEAFYVFDRNEDGFITAFELWSVLRRLGLKEGMKYEDCEEMIRVYDKNGDGRICFNEFKSMMEQVL